MEIRIVSPEDAAEIVRMANRIDTTSLQTAQTFRALLQRRAPEGTERLVAEVDGAIVAWAPSGVHADGITLVLANHEDARAETQMTAVRRDRRGRRLAYAVKVGSPHRARAAGLRTMLTANDVGNAPMLVVNRRLGFEAAAVVEDYERQVRAETSSSRAPRAPAT